MPTKTMLSPAQRAAIFDPPADRTTIERLYTLGPDDLVQVARRRRGPNRIGHAVQLCYLRHPGRALVASEAVPDAMLELLAGQIGCDVADFAGYAARPTTLREHRAEIEAWLGLRAFERADVRLMLTVGAEIAASTDRGTYEIAVIVHLRERLASGSIWVDGSRAYCTLDDYLLPVPAFETMRADGKLRLAVSPGFAEWHEERRTRLARRMTEVERAAAAGGLVDVTIERGQLLISPIRRSPADEADALKSRLYAMLPRVRITDLLVEVAAWSGFADRFVHARSGVPACDPSALMGAILADATNLGLGRMAESSRGLTLPRLRWTAEWHVRDETYLSALAAIVDCHTAYPENFRPDPPAFDVLVAASDVWQADPGRAFAVLRRLAGDKPTVFVMGNHEHWNGIVAEDLILAEALADRSGITLLDGRSATIAGCRFVGTTLWSDYRLAGHLDPATPTGEAIEIARNVYGDSHPITVGDAVALHRQAVASLGTEIAVDDGALPVMVVTHHAPHPDCIAPAQRATWNAGNSASDLSALTDCGRVRLWLRGHVHHSLDLTRPGGTRILCNPAGPRFANPAFDQARVVEPS